MSSKEISTMFNLHSQPLLYIWDSMQRLQTDFCFRQELSWYYNSRQWLDSNNILDVGTGNGYYLGKLATLFSDKIYLGIDSSKEFIEIANNEINSDYISFKYGNAFDIGGNYDFVILRLVIQHLSDIPSLLGHLAEIVKPGGSALIVDAYDAARFFHPPLPQFMNFFKAYTSNELQNGRDRNVIETVNRCLSTSTQWTMGSTMQLLIPSTIPGNLVLMQKNYALLIDLIEGVGKLDYDFEAVRNEWEWWCSLGNAYTQVGLTMMRIERLS